MLTIRKKSNKNFWHYDSNFTNAYSASDLTIIFDGDIVKLRSENGRIVFNKDGYLFSDITIYDDSSSGGAEVFASAILLAERLVALGYNGYYEGGDVVAGVSSAFGRTGAVVATNGDYNASQVTNALTDNTAQNITGVKTFTVSPIVPTPTTDFQASTKKYVDDNSGGGGSGTVTSVAVSGSNGIEVDSGSPITTAGTIALGLNKADTLSFLNVQDGAQVNNVSQTQTDFISGLIPLPIDSSYKLIVKAPYAGTITETTTISVSGTCTATFKINTTALGGTANSVSSTEESQAHASANAFVAGDDIVLTVSANATCVDMSFTIKFTKTLS